MNIKQWKDDNLAQFSYAVLSDCERKLVLIDPARNPEPYLDYAKENEAEIIGIIETHPHADFVSSHLEISTLTGAPVYVSKLVGVSYPHKTFDEGDVIAFGKIRLLAVNTPGHSPDSISIVLEHNGKQKAVFTGDTLFIGDCGRPDLREGAGNIKVKRDQLARQMYASLRDKLMTLPEDVVVYPAHGAGSLCGKSLSEAEHSTIGAEKLTNWSLQNMTEDEFVENLLADQPFIPAYFPYNVELNRRGAPPFRESIAKVKITTPVGGKQGIGRAQPGLWVVDARKEKEFKEGHLPHSVNLMEGSKFETWLGSIIRPEEKFYLGGASEEQLKRLIERAASIGYETQIEAAFVIENGPEKNEPLDLAAFKQDPKHYTIVDVRNPSEVKEKKVFDNALYIPLAEIRYRVHEIPTDKPIVVHCAGGYRSAAAFSLVKARLNGNTKVFDLSEAINEFSA